MKPRPADAAKVTFDQLRWTCVCLALALATQFSTLPIWLLVTVVTTGTIRLMLAARGRPPPGRIIRFGVAAVSILLLFLHFHTFNGLSAGTALLSLVAALKLLETQTRRDVYIITLIIYFLSLAALLPSESFWLLAYVIATLWLTTATSLRLTQSPPVPRWQRSALYAGRILLHSLPLAAVLWFLFPRFDGPLWEMPMQNSGAETGLSDSMSPGDINSLALSDDIAFRVHFNDATPPPRERYWRGPVLHDFDGRTWQRNDHGQIASAPLKKVGGEYRYTVSLEPNQHRWIFVLDWPSQWNAPRAFLTSDYMLMQGEPVSQPLNVSAISYTHVQAPEPLTASARERDTQLPPNRNPRTRALARQLREAHPDDMGLVTAVLDMFRQQPYYYTLNPPLLGQDPVDEFLFDTKRGFCGHYASAFATLARAAGIPTRIVTGYEGGTYNPYADYWLVRQRQAHAWDEIWIEGRGWVRIDPTSAIAPARVESGLRDQSEASNSLAARWQQHTPWLADLRMRIDAFQQKWRQRILRFDKSSQERLLLLFDIPEPDGHKLVLVLAVCLTVALAWLTWQVSWELKPSAKDPLVRVYHRLCRKLAAVGLPRNNHEGPEAYAARVARLRPDLAEAITALCTRYSEFRYGANPPDAASRTFAAQVRAFRPGARAPRTV